MSGWQPANNVTKGARSADLPITAWMYTPQRTRHVVYQEYSNTDRDRGHLIELHANPHSDQWILNDLTARANAPLLGGDGISGYIWSQQPSQHVIYPGSPLEGVHELWWTDSEGWNHHDLGKDLNVPPPFQPPFGRRAVNSGDRRGAAKTPQRQEPGMGSGPVSTTRSRCG